MASFQHPVVPHLLPLVLVMHIDRGLDLCLEVADGRHWIVQHRLLEPALAQQELAAPVQVLDRRAAQLLNTVISSR